MNTHGRPHGLYDPSFEKDACGVGFVADIRGRASHQIVLDADQVLRNMEHRGATGAESNTGDGAGMLTALPHRFLARVVRESLGFELPEPESYGAGNIFLPADDAERDHCKRTIERITEDHGQKVLGWRRVPVDPDGADLGPTARSSMPVVEQLFIAGQGVRGEALERKLYIIRKEASNGLINDARLRQRGMFYVCTLSTRLIVYKGMLTPGQLMRFYPDLADWEYRSHLAMVHSRFSTNTFPTWDRAQPLRCMSHNGEINTLRGNVGSMHDRQSVVASPHLGDQISHCFPVCEPSASDSGSFDNVLEFLLMGGRSLPSSIMMMIPEAWQKDEEMSAAKRAYYEYHSCLMEPWDGPASIAFTDGQYIGAVLDRNGLRPSRYYLTHDDRVIMASEAGVLPIDPSNIKAKGRLQPGRMFLVDFKQGRLIPDEEVKESIAAKNPYRQWLDEQAIHLKDISKAENCHGFDPETLIERARAFGYTNETMSFMLKPMVEQGRDPIGAMGNDAALAVLSDKSRLLYDYFKQLFAQVTNPPIDPIREEVVMSLACYIGPEGNLLDITEQHAHRLAIPHPILTNEELASLRDMDHRGYRSKVIDITWSRQRGASGIDSLLRRLSAEAEQAVDDGYAMLILSDRACGKDRVPISALLAVGAVHQHLVRVCKRMRVGLVLETGEAREVHHHCCLIGYGCDAVNPYLAFEMLWQGRRDGILPDELKDDDRIVKSYRKAVGKGMLKVMAKMGISTLQSYKGAQIFEAIGLHRSVVDQCFTGTPSRLGGVGFDVLAAEALRRHERAYPLRGTGKLEVLQNDGQFHFRADGEKHGWNPVALRHMQRAAQLDDREAYRQFAAEVNEGERSRTTLRSLLRFKQTTPVPIDEVEPAKEIVKRFVTGAMSFGSLSEEAHSSLAMAMNALGGKSNSGEGGEDPARYEPLPDGSQNPQRSAVKQVASGRFGVKITYLTNADEIQIKMAQGAKPGEGGELPGKKVDEQIARIRHSTPGVGLISPPPHHDIYSIEDLAQLISDLKNANPSARISVKLVSEVGVGTIAAGVAKAHADHILISGHDGGTGASPVTSVKHAGMPWELGIVDAHQTLVMNDLRSRVVLQTDGQLKTGRDVVIAALMGAEEFGFGTGPLIALGCIMMRKCHLNTCPVGVATQDPELRKKFKGKPEHLINYFFLVAEEAREIMARLGFRNVNEMIGRMDLLEVNKAIHHWKAQGLNLAPLLQEAEKPHPEVGVYCTRSQDHGLDHVLDKRLIELCEPAVERGEKVEASLPIQNVHRTVGTMLSHEIAKRWGEELLPDGTITLTMHGSAGQSFGAWLARGVTLNLEGDANDYVGKGLSGGRIVIRPPADSGFKPEENIIVGNVVLYGAIAGSAFFRGRAAERFAVRNSGASAVVEGVGDHGCEYMTGGRVVVLGSTGRNFAAGMSGGIAYVLDRDGTFKNRCNPGMVGLESVEEQSDRDELQTLIEEHRDRTGSELAAELLRTWDFSLRQFVKVMPHDYKRVLMERAQLERETSKGAA